MTTLPTGIPRLDALVHATATRYAQELQARCQYPFAVLNPHPAEWEGYIEDIGRLLRDLSRRESRDWAACALAGLVGVEVGDTAPSWTYSPAVRDSVASWTLTGFGRSRWTLCDYPPDIEAVLGPPVAREGHVSVRNLPTGWAESMVVALAAVCRDGAS